MIMISLESQWMLVQNGLSSMMCRRYPNDSFEFQLIFSIQFAVNHANNNYLNVKTIHPNVVDVFVGSDSTNDIHILLKNEYGV